MRDGDLLAIQHHQTNIFHRNAIVSTRLGHTLIIWKGYYQLAVFQVQVGGISKIQCPFNHNETMIGVRKWGLFTKKNL